jgi:hypothetical protein
VNSHVHDALGRPTLRLLDGKWAAFRVAALRCSFSRERRSVQADQLHVQVDTYLSELQREGTDVPPNSNGRALCNAWVNDDNPGHGPPVGTGIITRCGGSHRAAERTDPRTGS